LLPLKNSLAEESSLEALHADVLHRAEALHLNQNDPLKVLPRLTQAEQEKKDRPEIAREILESCVFDLNLIETQNTLDVPAHSWKQARLEMLFDLLRGYALAAILALLAIKLPWFRRKRKTHPRVADLGIVFLLLIAAVIFGWADILRFGVGAWSYFDLQIVLSVCAGLVGGPLLGVAAGLILATGRFLIQPDLWNGSAALLISGLIGGLFFFPMRAFKKPLIFSLGAGLVASVVHSLLIYFSERTLFPGAYLIGASFFVIVSESFGVFIFFAVMQGLIREEAQEATEHELLRSQLMFLQAQIKPHFLFNALNTISAVCSTEKAPRSRHLIGRLADFFRHALETQDPVMSLGKELEFVDTYLELEQARFGEDLVIVRQIQLSEQAREVKIPILVVQPVVENAIRHGLRKKTGVGTLTIEAREQDQNVIVCVTDDGAGTDPQFFENYLKKNIGKAEGYGIGVRNINERLRRFFGKGDWLRFETCAGKGTRVILRFPLAEKKGL